MRRYFKRTMLLAVSLIAVVALVGCQGGSSNTDNKNLSKDEILEKSFQGFEQLKNGKISITTKHNGVKKNPKEGEEPKYWREKKFRGSFELRPNRVSGEAIVTGTTMAHKKIEYKYYGDSMLSYELPQVPKKSKVWTTNQYSDEFYGQPLGFNYDFIEFLREHKKDVKLSEEKDSYTFTYETSDLKLVDPNNYLIFGALDTAFGLYDFYYSGSAKIVFKVSKEDFTPMGITYTGEYDAEYASEKMTSKVTYSDQNTGIVVETPDGVDKAEVK